MRPALPATLLLLAAVLVPAATAQEPGTPYCLSGEIRDPPSLWLDGEACGAFLKGQAAILCIVFPPCIEAAT